LRSERIRPGLGIIDPCLPSPAKVPPSGPGWIHEIKHDGFRILAPRGPAGVLLITRNGNDFTSRFPFVEMEVKSLPVSSCLIDGEAIVCVTVSSARSDVTSDLFKAVEMSRLAQRLGAGVGIAAGIRFARLCESRLSLCIRFALGILDRAGRGLMMKLRAYGLISTRCSRATGRRRRC